MENPTRRTADASGEPRVGGPDRADHDSRPGSSEPPPGEQAIAVDRAQSAPGPERSEVNPSSSPPGPRVDVALWLVLAIGLFAIAGVMLSVAL